jgi:hypothetical protein
MSYFNYPSCIYLEQAVGNRVGVVEPFLLRMAHGAPVVQGGNGRPRIGKFVKGKVSPPFQRSKLNSPGGVQLPVEQMLRVCKRFFVALMLSKLVQVFGILYNYVSVLMSLSQVPSEHFTIKTFNRISQSCLVLIRFSCCDSNSIRNTEHLDLHKGG